MDVELINLCFDHPNGIWTVELLKKGNRAVLRTKDDVLHLKNEVDGYLRSSKLVSFLEYKESMFRMLEKHELKFTGTEFIPRREETNFFRDQRIMVENQLKTYNESNSEKYGTIFDNDNVIAYRGEVLDGEAHGYGKMLYPTGIVEYEGTFNHSQLEGKGN